MDRLVQTAIRIALNEAKGRELDAGYSGIMGDNGGGELRNKVKVYQDVLEGRTPEFMNEYIEKAKHLIEIEDNPNEYSEYQRLKAKFEK